MSEIRDRVVRVVSEIAEIPAAELEQVSSFTELSKWDSLIHLNVVLGLEKEFDIHFDLNELTEITGPDQAVALVSKRL